MKNEREALVYFAECQLATVSGLALKRRPPKGELSRHCAIAAKVLYAIVGFCGDGSEWRNKSRVQDRIATYLASGVRSEASMIAVVSLWARELHDELHGGIVA